MSQLSHPDSMTDAAISAAIQARPKCRWCGKKHMPNRWHDGQCVHRDEDGIFCLNRAKVYRNKTGLLCEEHARPIERSANVREASEDSPVLAPESHSASIFRQSAVILRGGDVIPSPWINTDGGAGSSDALRATGEVRAVVPEGQALATSPAPHQSPEFLAASAELATILGQPESLEKPVPPAYPNPKAVRRFYVRSRSRPTQEHCVELLEDRLTCSCEAGRTRHRCEHIKDVEAFIFVGVREVSTE